MDAVYRGKFLHPYVSSKCWRAFVSRAVEPHRGLRRPSTPRTKWYNLDLAFFFFTEYSHVAAFTHLQAGALVRKRRAEESRYDAHDRLRHVTLQNGVGVLALARAVAHLQSSGQLNSEPGGFFLGCLDVAEEGRDNAYPADVDQEVLKEFPHVVGGVDLFHLHLRVNIAVVQEVDVSDLHLKCWDLVEHGLSVRVSPRLCPEWHLTSGIQSSCVTTRTMSSRGNRELHLISV